MKNLSNNQQLPIVQLTDPSTHLFNHNNLDCSPSEYLSLADDNKLPIASDRKLNAHNGTVIPDHKKLKW